MVKRTATKIREWLNENVQRKQILPVYLALTLAIVGGLSRFDSLSEERVRDRFAIAAQFDYVQCLARVDNRAVIRNVFHGIFDQFPESDGVTQLKSYLDNEYPPLSDAECDQILMDAGVDVEPRPVPAD